jgi:hypothetical protein
MVDDEDENWRDNEESLELAVLEAVTDVERAKTASFCMREDLGGRRGVNSEGSLQATGGQ